MLAVEVAGLQTAVLVAQALAALVVEQIQTVLMHLLQTEGLVVVVLVLIVELILKAEAVHQALFFSNTQYLYLP
jgi:hypothetical protein